MSRVNVGLRAAHMIVVLVELGLEADDQVALCSCQHVRSGRPVKNEQWHLSDLDFNSWLFNLSSLVRGQLWSRPQTMVHSLWNDEIG